MCVVAGINAGILLYAAIHCINRSYYIGLGTSQIVSDLCTGLLAHQFNFS